MLDIWLSEPLSKAHIDHVKACVYTRLNVLKEVEQTFLPHGLTVVFILSESPFSMHTYPEHNYLSLDCYVCNPTVNLDALATDILDELPHRRVEQKEHHRGD